MQEFLLTQKGLWLYLTAFFALLGGAFGLPIPEDLPLIGSGIAIHKGYANPILIFLVCYVAVVLGDLILFMMGRRLGSALFMKRWFRTRIPPKKIRKLQNSLEKRSFITIFIARHLFYIRSFTFLTCGAVKMNLTQFIINDCIAALISIPIMMSVGYLFSEHYEEILKTIKGAEWVIGLVIILVIFGLYFFKKYRKSKV